MTTSGYFTSNSVFVPALLGRIARSSLR